MSRSGLTAFFCLIFACASVYAAEFETLAPQHGQPVISAFHADTSYGCTHRLSGRIVEGDAQVVVKALEEYSSFRVVCLESPGGSLSESLTIASFFRDELIGTKLEEGAVCESACAIIFMSGSAERQNGYFSGKWRIMHPSAKLGFHAPALNVSSGQYSAESVTRAYEIALQTLSRTIQDLMQNRGFPDGEHMKPSLMAAMLNTAPNDMLYVDTVDRAGRWGVTIEPLFTDNTPIGDNEFRRACANEHAWEIDQSAVSVEHWKDYLFYWEGDVFNEARGIGSVTVFVDPVTVVTCQYTAPLTSIEKQSAFLNEVTNRSIPPITFFDPSLRLEHLPY